MYSKSGGWSIKEILIYSWVYKIDTSSLENTFLVLKSTRRLLDSLNSSDRAVHGGIDSSLYKETKEFYHFIVICVISRIWRIEKYVISKICRIENYFISRIWSI